jgi:preprotein translocase subunit SecA
MAQRDPLVEYQREGFDMFNGMLEAIKEESVGFLFNVEVQVQPTQPEVDAEAVEAGSNGATSAARPVAVAERHTPAVSAKGLDAHPRTDNLQYSAPTLDAAEPDAPATAGAAVSGGEPGRNAPCPCGSGKKYKRCHGAPAGAR